MTVFFSQLINGLSLGSIYALIALGYSMVYGIILLLNFAHGDVIMVGAYMSWFVMNQLGLGPVTAVCATIITCTLLGVVIEKVAYTPLRNAPRISLLITAIGVSFFLEYTAELVMGSGAKVIPSYYGNKTFMIGSVPLGLTSVITLVVTVLSMLVLTFLVQKTKLGKAMRAVSEDMDAARLMGINVNSTISFTFAVGSALAGIGSVLYCCSYPQATPTMGSMLGLKAFVAAVLGGIGSIPGAMVGGIVIGLCECFVSAIGLSAWKDAVTFAILIIVLLFTFQSVGLPILLILVIQGSIWINFSFPGMAQKPIFFLSYLIVTAIQMGANIDYAIVISSWYNELKAEMSRRDAIVQALNLSFPTVLTSGSILSSAGFLIAQITTEPAIVGIGECLCRGTLISMFLVMFILPQILFLGDGIVERTRFDLKVPEVARSAHGTVYVNGRVRGRISGVVDAQIQGVIYGDVSGMLETGAYQKEEEPAHETEDS